MEVLIIVSPAMFLAENELQSNPHLTALLFLRDTKCEPPHAVGIRYRPRSFMLGV